MLQASGIAASALITSGIGTASSSSSAGKQKLRLRGNLSNPLSIPEIYEQKEAVIRNSSLYEENSTVPNIQAKGFSQDEKVLAYNFDIVNGVPTEWTGTHKSVPNAETASASTAGVTKKERREAAEQRILNKAAVDAQEKRKQKNNTTEDSVTQSSVSTSTTTDSWSDWTKKAESDNYITSDNGNDLSWESKWKHDPSDTSQQGLNTELIMRPYDQGLNPWENVDCEIDFDYNGSTFKEIADYGPGNSIGTNTDTFNLAVSSDSVVQVGISSSTTSSNMDIDNKSDTDANYVYHWYDISGDLTTNTIRVNQSAVTAGTDESEAVTYCDQDLQGMFNSPGGREYVNKEIKVEWV